ncbi:MAG: hypothetical protein JXA54_09995 [Candidatus Heimdallarchaeota archaeon]|nr:hypothetical protein [Candidatus Heimdallarchaeota archaeon]
MVLTLATKLLMAIVTEGIVLLSVSFVVLFLYIKYTQRKKSAALALAVAFTFYNIAIVCLFTFRILAYLQEIGTLSDYYGFSEIGISLGYGFSALSNIFIVIFVSIIFSRAPIFRRSRVIVPLIPAALNGVTIGLLIGNAITNWPTPTYDLGPTIYHLVLTFIAFISLIRFTVPSYKAATLKWEKAGFQFIIVSGVFGILVYLSFVVDVILGDITGIFPNGYTPFFFFAYVCAILMCNFAYLGYSMPNAVRKWFKE